MGFRFDLDTMALPILGVSVLAFIYCIIHHPFVLGALPIFFVSVIIVAKNQPCRQQDVHGFFHDLRICAHRGSPHVFPENGIAGFKQAKIDGANLIEFDVALTKDGKAVLLHDDDLDRTTNMTGLIREKKLEELKNANIAANFKRTALGKYGPVEVEGIPSLEDTVKWAVENKMKMLFDVKDSDTDLVNIIAFLFEKYHLYDKAIVCSFFPWVVYRIKQGNQKILTGLTWRQKFFSYHDIENTRPRYSGIKHYVFVAIDIIHVYLLQTVTPWFLGADLLLTNNLDISKSFVDEQKKKGLHVAVWTVNNIAEMHWMLDFLEVPILTDHPYYSSRIAHLDEVKLRNYLPELQQSN